MPTIRTTLRALTTLCDAARVLTECAERRAMKATAKQTRHIARYLDATRTTLLQEDADYLDVALAIQDVCADRLLAHALYIGKHDDREPLPATDAAWADAWDEACLALA